MNRRLFLLCVLLPLSACSSPELLSGVGPKLLAAPLLTYVDGDPAAGTTTIFSAPILTYHGAHIAPGLEESTTCVVPLLAHSQSATHQIRVVRKERGSAGCPDDEGWWAERDPLAPKKSARERRAEKAKRKQGGVSLSRPKQNRAKRRRRKSETLSATEGEDPKLTFERVGAEDGRTWKGYTLALPPDAEVTKHKYPATSGEVSVLWPLVRLKRDLPGRVGVRQGGVTRVYEVGPQRTEMRVLPLFSHTSTFDTSETILWPLLGFGWETTPKGTYVRLFYFLRFKID